MYTEPTNEQLVRFVIESNLIEGIDAPVGHHLFEHHLKAAQYVVDCVKQSILPDIKKIHMILMTSALHNAGQFRSTGMEIVSPETGEVLVELPKASTVERLMLEWQTRINLEFVPLATLCGNVSPKQLDFLTWELHHHLLCVHPFEDGNGRTSRLFLNGVRGLCNLPWMTVLAGNRGHYYKLVEEYEMRTFKPAHPDVYPAAT